MSRYVFLSFAFMGWGFYELSGGSDFDPDAERAARLAAAPLQVGEVTPPEAPPVPVWRGQPAPQPTLSDSAPPEGGETPNTVVRAREQPLRGFNPEKLPLVKASVPTREARAAPLDGGVIPATEAPLLGERIIEETPELDLRQIRPSRANVRMGPGVHFNVVMRLDRGEEVRVLQNPGNGWVKMRVLSNGRIGWISEKLLSTAQDG